MALATAAPLSLTTHQPVRRSSVHVPLPTAATTATTMTLPRRVSASLGFWLSGWAVPIAGAFAGGLLFGTMGAVAGGVLGYLLIRR